MAATGKSTSNLDKYDLAVKKVGSTFSRSIKENRKLMEDSAKSGGMSNDKKRLFNQHLLRTSLLSKEYLNIQRQIGRELDALLKKQADLAKQTGPTSAINKAETQSRITELQEKKKTIKNEASVLAQERKNVFKEFGGVKKTGKEEAEEEKGGKGGKKKPGGTAGIWGGVGGLLGGGIGLLGGPAGVAIGASIGASIGAFVGEAVDRAKGMAMEAFEVTKQIAGASAPLEMKGFGDTTNIKTAGRKLNMSARETLGMVSAFTAAGGGGAQESDPTFQKMAGLAKGTGIDVNTMGGYVGGMGSLMRQGSQSANAGTTILANSLRMGINKSSLPQYMQSMVSVTENLASGIPSMTNGFQASVSDFLTKLIASKEEGGQGFSVKSAAQAATSLIDQTQTEGTTMAGMALLGGTNYAQGIDAQITRLGEIKASAKSSEDIDKAEALRQRLISAKGTKEEGVEALAVSRITQNSFAVQVQKYVQEYIEKQGLGKLVTLSISDIKTQELLEGAARGASKTGTGAGRALDQGEAQKIIDARTIAYEKTREFKMKGIEVAKEAIQETLVGNTVDTFSNQLVIATESVKGLAAALDNFLRGKSDPSVGALPWGGTSTVGSKNTGVGGKFIGTLLQQRFAKEQADKVAQPPS